MEIGSSCSVYISTLLLLLCDQLHAFYWNNAYGGALIGKRGGMRPFAFPCNGFDNLPRCLHGGKGPRKTWTKAGRFCVCLCFPKWKGPECSFAEDVTVGKRGEINYGSELYPRQQNTASGKFPWIKKAESKETEPRPFSWKSEASQNVAYKRNDPFYVYEGVPWDQNSDLIFNNKK